MDTDDPCISAEVQFFLQHVKTEWWGAGVVVCLERGADYLHMVQLMPLPSQTPIISCLV